MTSILPSSFILYMTDRKSQSDICSGLVHMTAEQITDESTGLVGYRLTQSPPALNQVFTIHFVPGSEIPYVDYPRPFVRIVNTENHLLYKRFVNLSSLFLATGPTGAHVPVYAMVSRTNVFKGIRLKRNVGFTVLANPNTNVNANANANANANTVANANTSPRKKNTTTLPTTSIFLAKQALELAVMKKETCPITMDEFSANNTAVMPCGHIFSTIAIAESFKSCMNQCPVCRVAGLATYV